MGRSGRVALGEADAVSALLDRCTFHIGHKSIAIVTQDLDSAMHIPIEKIIFQHNKKSCMLQFNKRKFLDSAMHMPE